MITQTEVTKYINTLDPQTKRIYKDANNLRISWSDTLDDEFQIVNEIVLVFWKYAERLLEEDKE